MKFFLSTLPVFLLIIVFSFAFDSLLQPKEQTNNAAKRDKIINTIVQRFAKVPKKNINLPPYPWYGDANAPVAIVEFSDFMCPHCKRLAPALKAFVRQSRGKVKLKFINHPLDKKCNKNMTRQMHEGACEMAKGAICANKQGKFWEYHDQIFTLSGHKISRKEIIDKAAITGLELNDFEKCLMSKSTNSELAKEIEEGDRLDISGTPSIFINGKSYKFAVHPLILVRIVEAELKKLQE